MYQIVSIQNIKILIFRYENKEHEDFVRDVLWNLDGANKFYSCGWDHKVIPHTF